MSGREEGEYRCLAVNTEGSAEVRVQVDVIRGGATGNGERMLITSFRQNTITPWLYC